MSYAVDLRDLKKPFNTLVSFVRAARKLEPVARSMRAVARLVRTPRIVVLACALPLLLTRAATGPGSSAASAGLPVLICGSLTAVVSATLNLIFSALIGLCAVFLEDTSPLYWVWQRLSFMFGGLMFPLDLYPGPMRAVADLTPFPSLPYASDRIALGAEPAFVGHAVAVLAGWAVFSALAPRYALRRALKALEINGG